ncbi:hypothetical protein GW17_00060576 [Ensete ventricosum]|nr:hypothetical protein GW17_00060576 [Ensete ventricosum]
MREFHGITNPNKDGITGPTCGNAGLDLLAVEQLLAVLAHGETASSTSIIFDSPYSSCCRSIASCPWDRRARVAIRSPRTVSSLWAQTGWRRRRKKRDGVENRRRSSGRLSTLAVTARKPIKYTKKKGRKVNASKPSTSSWQQRTSSTRRAARKQMKYRRRKKIKYLREADQI